MAPPINTCVLGVGLSGLTFHVPFILALPELFALQSVLERSPSSEGGKVKERFGVHVKTHKSLEDVLGDPTIELVIIGTPSHTHYNFAKAALESGKHVLVDKPATATAKEAQELGEIAKKNGLILYAFHNRRWDSDFLALKRLLEQKRDSPLSLGDVTEFESHFDRYRKDLKGTWKDVPSSGNGTTYDLGSHLVDQALCLFGKPASITAFIQNMRCIGNSEVDDSFTIHMHYEVKKRPLTVILRSHPLSVRLPQVRYIVRGTRGTYIKYGIDAQEEQLKIIKSPSAILESQFGKEPHYLWGSVEKMEVDDITVTKSTWPSEKAGCYIELFQNLAAAIRSGAEPLVKWEEATTVIKVIETSHQSAKEGRTIHLNP